VPLWGSVFGIQQRGRPEASKESHLRAFSLGLWGTTCEKETGIAAQCKKDKIRHLLLKITRDLKRERRGGPAEELREQENFSKTKIGPKEVLQKVIIS
jgi:hypothetical protein